MQAVCPECSRLNPLESKFCGNCGTSLENATIVKPVERPEQRAQPANKEAAYFSSGGVKVTSARAMLGAKTYSMANITSVSMADDPPKRFIGIAITALGILAIIIAIGSDADSWFWFGIGGLITLFGLFLVAFQRHEYIVRIGSASGESDALKSTDKEKIQKIVSAINRAIIERE